MPHQSWRLVLVLAGAAAATGGAAAASDGAPAVDPAPRKVDGARGCVETIRFGVIDGIAPLSVAPATAWLDDAPDLCFAWYRQPSGPVALEKISNGDLDFAAMGSVPFTTAIERGAPAAARAASGRGDVAAAERVASSARVGARPTVRRRGRPADRCRGGRRSPPRWAPIAAAVGAVRRSGRPNDRRRERRHVKGGVSVGLQPALVRGGLLVVRDGTPSARSAEMELSIPSSAQRPPPRRAAFPPPRATDRPRAGLCDRYPLDPALGRGPRDAVRFTRAAEFTRKHDRDRPRLDVALHVRGLLARDGHRPARRHARLCGAEGNHAALGRGRHRRRGLLDADARPRPGDAARRDGHAGARGLRRRDVEKMGLPHGRAARRARRLCGAAA